MATASAYGESSFFSALSWGPCFSWVLDVVVDASFGLFASLGDSELIFFPSGFGLARLFVVIADGGVHALVVGEGVEASVADETA